MIGNHSFRRKIDPGLMMFRRESGFQLSNSLFAKPKIFRKKIFSRRNDVQFANHLAPTLRYRLTSFQR